MTPRASRAGQAEHPKDGYLHGEQGGAAVLRRPLGRGRLRHVVGPSGMGGWEVVRPRAVTAMRALSAMSVTGRA